MTTEPSLIDEQRLGVGGNLPPETADQQSEIIRARIEKDHKWLVDRQKELLAALPRVPETIDADNVGQATDFIKQLQSAAKSLNGARVSEKEPFLAAGRTVDGLFKKLTEPLKAAKANIQARVDVYLKAKEAEERRKREEAAERQRQERERIEREARETEERRRIEERERAKAAQKVEDDRLAEIERKEQERLEAIQAEKHDRRRKVQIRFEEGRIDVDRKLELYEQIDAQSDRATDESDAALERAFDRAEKASGREAERLEIEKRQAAREAARDEKTIVRAKAQETKAEKAADAPAADLARERGDYGSVATLKTEMNFRVVSWEDLDLEALRPFIGHEALEQAIRAYIRVGRRELAGAEIYQDLVGQTR